MSSRVTIDVGFYFQNQHYAQLQGYLPRSEAILIPQLQVQNQENQPEPNIEVSSNRPSRNVKSESKRGSEDQMIDEDDNVGQNENDGDNEIENEEEQVNEEEQERQREVEDALQELEQEEVDSEQESQSYDSDREDDIEDMESVSSPQDLRNFTTNKTKRQKGQTKDLIELPDRRPRKGKMLDEASEVVRREEKERKRKQYLKKQIQAHEKATIDKILNETGRKLRQREEKQIKEELEREQKAYRTLGDVPKIIEIDSQEGTLVMIHKTKLFPASMTTTPDLKMRENCTSCGQTSKYTLKGGNKFACSLSCYKVLTV